jgi:hypothetical protein
VGVEGAGADAGDLFEDGVGGDDEGGDGALAGEFAAEVAEGFEEFGLEGGDGGPWVAPGGTRVERTEFGGSVGILVVP